ETLGKQLAVNPRAAVGTTTLLEGRFDGQSEPRSRLRSYRLQPLRPGVEAARRYPQGMAQHRYRVVDLLRRDEAVPHRFSLAKKAVAFFKISRSICSRLFSRRSRCSSSRSAVVSSPRPRPSSMSAWRTQLRTADSVRSRSRAISAIFLPPVRTSRTVSCLNSSVNARRVRFVMAHPSRHYRLIGGVHIV